MHGSLKTLLVLATLCAAGGAQCQRLTVPFANQPPQPPRALPEYPTLSQVIETVNTSTARVQSLSSSSLRITAAGTPSLSGQLAIERPSRFRLKAHTAITGPEVDLGSNADEFWLWVRRGQPPALYTCRHDQFPYSAARAVVPIDPQWLIEAVGLPTLDPAGQHYGPETVRPGRLEVRSIVASPTGPMTRVTQIDARGGFVVEQHVYDSQGTRVASSIGSRHVYDPTYGVTLPRQIDIQMPSGQINLRLELNELIVNRLVGDPSQMFLKPFYEGFPEVNLGQTAPTLPAGYPLSLPTP
ncbi:MAG: hypothetical protein KDA42_04195 [Planctomycetales bacterium]|nr:hypothetical protein [Planctomycetales bacterium]